MKLTDEEAIALKNCVKGRLADLHVQRQHGGATPELLALESAWAKLKAKLKI